MNKLVLPKQLCKSLNRFIELVGPQFRGSGLRIGGGSVLAARWNHRLSTDIDLFVDANPAGEFIKKDGISFVEVGTALNSLAEQGTVSELKLLDHGCSFCGPFGPMSLYASRRFTRSVLSQDQESTTGLPTETSREILFKKLYGRVIRSVTHVGRDMYDFIVAFMIDPRSLDHALNKPKNIKGISMFTARCTSRRH